MWSHGLLEAEARTTFPAAAAAGSRPQPGSARRQHTRSLSRWRPPRHNSRSAGTGTVHLYLAAAATHLPSQPGPTYTPTQAPGSTWWPLRARCSTAYSTLPTQLAPTVMSCEHGTLGPGLVHPSPQPVFSHQTYMSTSPASTVYTGYPLRCTKVNQYPYIPSSGSGRERRENG